MSRDKQIDEMAHDMSDSLVYFSGEPKIINWVKTLENMYSKGYRKSCDVAREIFEEIEKDGKYAISFVENHKSYSEEVRQAKLECYKDIQNYIAELKKKFEGSENA